MGKKNKPDAKGFVYSTDPNFRFEHESGSAETLPPALQRLKIQLNTRYRAGKAVTVVTGFTGNENDKYASYIFKNSSSLLSALYTYKNKLKLILCGFHEAALMSHSAYKYMNPGVKYTMKYTTVQGVNEF